jgi:hypothetical protein
MKLRDAKENYLPAADITVAITASITATSS